MTHSDDRTLVERTLAGDTHAFGELVRRYSDSARRVARAILRNPDDADDAAQDAFLAAFQHLARYDVRRPFGPWLLRSVTNVAIDRGRRRSVRRAEPLTEELVARGDAPDRAAENREWSDRLRDALQELPERQRIAVVLFDAEGYSHAEIAEIVGVPVGTVRSDVHHARKKLRALLPDWRST